MQIGVVGRPGQPKTDVNIFKLGRCDTSICEFALVLLIPLLNCHDSMINQHTNALALDTHSRHPICLEVIDIGIRG